MKSTTLYCNINILMHFKSLMVVRFHLHANVVHFSFFRWICFIFCVLKIKFNYASDKNNTEDGKTKGSKRQWRYTQSPFKMYSIITMCVVSNVSLHLGKNKKELKIECFSSLKLFRLCYRIVRCFWIEMNHVKLHVWSQSEMKTSINNCSHNSGKKL